MLTLTTIRFDSLDALRSVIVSTCALALIFAA